MKKYLPVILVILAIFTSVLSGCGNIDYKENLDLYEKEMEYSENFTILQITDLHWSTTTDTATESLYLENLVEFAKAHAGKIDLIAVTGDAFMLGNFKTVKAFIKVMTEINIPYAIIWGNHDKQGLYSANRLSKAFLNAENSLYTEVDNDNVYGRSNYVINLTKDGMVKWQLAFLDSGATLRTNATELSLDYDYLRDDQLEWLSAIHEKAGSDVPLIIYYHIPQGDIAGDWAEIESGDTDITSDYNKLELFAESTRAPKVHELFKSLNAKAVFYGHAHNNDLTYTKEGVVYGFGVKTGLELYYTDFTIDSETYNLCGASLLTIKDEDSFELEHFYYTYGQETVAFWEKYNG